MVHRVTSHILNHTDKNSILYPLQHRFRSKRLCETKLVEFVEDITQNMAAGKQTDILIMDFLKASDKVCHSLHVHKIRHYGIKGKVNQWQLLIGTKSTGHPERWEVAIHKCWIRSPTGQCPRFGSIPKMSTWHYRIQVEAFNTSLANNNNLRHMNYFILFLNF